MPAYSGGVVTTFKQPLAAASWQLDEVDLGPRRIRSRSRTGSCRTRSSPEEVLLAWEHVARLRNALITRPDAFVVFPSPIGPKGLAYMPVLAGLAIPRTAPNPNGREGADPAPPERQHAGADALGGRLLPGRRRAAVQAPPPGCGLESNAVKIMQASPTALPALLPIGLGAEGGNFNTVYRNTFTRIVHRGESTPAVLNEEGGEAPGDHGPRRARRAGGPSRRATVRCQVK